jgi:hypothetical protein
MAERIFYATHYVSLGGRVLKGVQSVSLSSNFGLEPVFQLGQCNHVEVVPSVPECEVTITRSVLGGPAITLDITNDCTTAEALLNTEEDIQIISDAGSFTVGNAYLSGYSVNFNIEGVFTEEITYVGDTITSAGGGFSALNDQVHLPRRQDWTGPAGATSASLSLDISRDAVYVLGQYQPIKRFVQFPIEATLDIAYLLPQGGGLGIQDPPNCAPWTEGKQTFTIGACDHEWLVRDAYLSNIGYSGGDTGGGNVEVSYSYSSWSNFKIS